MSKNKSKKILNEISEKLKNTIKKYNEISIDNDLTLQKSQDTQNGNEKLPTFNNDKIGDDYNENFKKTNFSLGEQKINETLDSRQNAFIGQINQIINNLNKFEESVNIDFDELEEFVENAIEKELSNSNK